MAFDPLADFYEFEVVDFPQEWLPLTYLYDPDLPLFPILYFHELDPAFAAGQRAGEKDRIFGFVHSVAFSRSTGALKVTVATSKDLLQPRNSRFIPVVEAAARSRLGLDNPVLYTDVQRAFSGPLAPANRFLEELWHQVVSSSFGGKLPFGSCWDPVLGLARFIASWNSDSGRKGELIQLHAFVAAFGERIQTGGGIHADFYLLPTWVEFRDRGNPLAFFPKYAALVGPGGATEFFGKNYVSPKALPSGTYGAFNLKSVGGFRVLDTAALVAMMDSAPRGRVHAALYDNYSAFNRGPPRAVLSLLMHHDLRFGGWDPASLSHQHCIDQYTELARSYQSPKVMQLFAQQCFGSLPALPLDNWVKTFVHGPLALPSSRDSVLQMFTSSSVWGKIERVIWMAAQARKVHSSVAENVLWCVRYGGPQKQLRGANPLSCKVCEDHIRRVCPAYDAVRTKPVHFNAPALAAGDFNLRTSAGNNSSPGQTFVACESSDTFDEYTPRDRPGSFNSYPATGHSGTPLTVETFLSSY